MSPAVSGTLHASASRLMVSPALDVLGSILIPGRGLRLPLTDNRVM
jgi:hypothetical protein